MWLFVTAAIESEYAHSLISAKRDEQAMTDWVGRFLQRMNYFTKCLGAVKQNLQNWLVNEREERCHIPDSLGRVAVEKVAKLSHNPEVTFWFKWAGGGKREQSRK